MKKGLKKMMAVTLLSVQALLTGGVAHGINLTEDASKLRVEVTQNTQIKKVVFGNGFEYVVRLESSPESSYYDNKLGKTIYKKTATAYGEFFYTENKSKDKSINKIAANSLSVTFTYDKQGFVKIERPSKDILSSSYRFEKTNWKIRQNYEIFRTTGECIVSQMSMMYRDLSRYSHLKYTDNANLDLICSVSGDINFSSKAY